MVFKKKLCDLCELCGKGLFMCSDNQYEKICKDEFALVHKKLDKLDEAIRGNGKVGITTRLDRLERSEAVRSKLLWLITASSVTGAVSLVVAVILQIARIH